MKKAEKEQKVAELWEKYSSLLAERRELEKEAKALKAEEEAVKGALIALVPEGGEVSGVRHTVRRRVSVRYSEVYERIVGELVPKTKAGAAEEIRAACSSESVVHEVKG
jgi:hypothetical protein